MSDFTRSSHTDTNQQKQRRELVSDGIDVILSVFSEVGQQRLFPRTIMTKKSNGQIVAHSKEEIIYWFEAADYLECRVNAYPTFLSEAEEQDYKKGINVNLFAANILFIDLDAKNFKSEKEFQRALKQILKNIVNVLHGVKPLVIWSGHGYHIIIPVNAKEALENFEEFTSYTSEPSKAFLQFAEKYLSLNNADTANNPGFKSCLLRVPHTFNSKCIDEGIDAVVKVVQQWDSSKPLTEIDNLLIEFQTFLVDKKLKTEIKENEMKKRTPFRSAMNSNTILYIEKLLTIPILNYRKFAISLILGPYFVNIRHISEDDSFDRIKQWALRCNEGRRLAPSLEYFDDLIRKAIQRAKITGIKPLKFEETLQYKNKEMYHMLNKARAAP